jgi:hypothetical protein
VQDAGGRRRPEGARAGDGFRAAQLDGEDDAAADRDTTGHRLVPTEALAVVERFVDGSPP